MTPETIDRMLAKENDVLKEQYELRKSPYAQLLGPLHMTNLMLGEIAKQLHNVEKTLDSSNEYLTEALTQLKIAIDRAKP